MAIQTGTQSLLIQVVGDETDATAQHEQTVQDTHLQIVFSLLCREGARVAEQVHEAHGYTAINVEDKIVLLGRGDRLNGNRIVQQFVAGEVLGNILLDQLDTQIRVVAGLDLVADTRDWLFHVSKRRKIRPNKLSKRW